MKRLIYLALPAMLLVSTAFAAPKAKTSICHFDEELGLWVPISIPDKAASAHLSKHDDAAPGAVTAVSGTQLDANCEAAAAVVE